LGVRDGPATDAGEGAEGVETAGVTGAIGDDGAVDETELDCRRREDLVGPGVDWRWAGIGEATAIGPPGMIVDFG